MSRRLRRLWTCVVGAAVATGCTKPPNPGDPLRGLTREERASFDAGRQVFGRVFTPATGLGPLFNSTSCAECHEDPAPGGPGDEVEVHVATLLPGGVCDPFAKKGGLVIQQQVTPALKAALGIDKEPTPPGATEAHRSSPSLFGFGLLDAVPDATILARADPDDRDKDGISGRPNHSLDGRIGRFGRKALVPTLREFNDGAFPVEMGLTNPAVPTEETIGGEAIPPGVDPLPEPEVDQAAIDATDDFVRFLAPPAPLKLSSAAKSGRAIFSRIRCDACHVPTLKTGDNRVKALRYKEVSAYTDLLLHDMGPELADICLGDATASEFRTEPLMGLRLAERFLHDGRTASVEEAIRLHGGEARASRDKFVGLSEAERSALLEFLRSL
ncbi:MAG TPA: di-heme oxidoredictase family protein [Vicinamibacteria bacterium]|nr:di-heme oxidoredictase family protein [Vicinamibacteria bacterium]